MYLLNEVAVSFVFAAKGKALNNSVLKLTGEEYFEPQRHFTTGSFTEDNSTPPWFSVVMWLLV